MPIFPEDGYLVSIGKFAGSCAQLTYDGFFQRRFEGLNGKTSEFLGFLTGLALSDINPPEFFALIIRRKAADDWHLGFFTRTLG
jgi:hypothetical protein